MFDTNARDDSQSHAEYARRMLTEADAELTAEPPALLQPSHNADDFLHVFSPRRAAAEPPQRASTCGTTGRPSWRQNFSTHVDWVVARLLLDITQERMDEC